MIPYFTFYLFGYSSFNRRTAANPKLFCFLLLFFNITFSFASFLFLCLPQEASCLAFKASRSYWFKNRSLKELFVELFRRRIDIALFFFSVSFFDANPVITLIWWRYKSRRHPKPLFDAFIRPRSFVSARVLCAVCAMCVCVCVFRRCPSTLSDPLSSPFTSLCDDDDEFVWRIVLSCVFIHRRSISSDRPTLLSDLFIATAVENLAIRWSYSIKAQQNLQVASKSLAPTCRRY